MAFRADESAKRGLESVTNYFISRSIEGGERERSKDKILDIIDKFGTVVDSYPSWHPLVSNNNDRRCPVTTPSDRCGYNGLDHTIYFVNAFITCPYNDGQKIIESVNRLPYNPIAQIMAEQLDVQLYSPSVTPILVYCNWRKTISSNGMIPESIAIPLMLLKELPDWEWAEVGETWETMRYYFLGSPHGSSSSLFVNQKTSSIMKKIWNLLVNTGMFGPIEVRPIVL
ncbi:MAG: hypothetical protein ACTFAL_05905 [Candidatus Electronema sp. V4]|uniref:hypothetical protein n=1 Tax=Candidatus Electronema sp. V4 TaxID=3454756 RepID=UPI00405568EC